MNNKLTEKTEKMLDLLLSSTEQIQTLEAARNTNMHVDYILICVIQSSEEVPLCFHRSGRKWLSEAEWKLWSAQQQQGFRLSLPQHSRPWCTCAYTGSVRTVL